jgi:hypothetical protein
MQPLDRLFATLSYPYDALAPSAVWLALCAAALAGMAALLRRRGHPAPARILRRTLWIGLADMAAWLAIFVARILNEGDSPMWLLPLEAPYAAARGAIDALLWNAVGVSAAIEHDQLFRGYQHWDGTPLVLLAALLNEAAFVALAACAIYCATWRSPRK